MLMKLLIMYMCQIPMDSLQARDAKVNSKSVGLALLTLASEVARSTGIQPKKHAWPAARP